MLYEWQGREKPLGLAIVIAQQLTIATFEEADGGLIQATGSITIMDYTEGSGGDHRWKAEGVREHLPGDRVIWKIESADILGWTNKDNQPIFTLSRTVNDAIKVFVAEKLTAYIAAPKDENGVAPKDEPIVYDGPMARYIGPCVCEKLLAATAENPFPWEEMTQGGQYPNRCFACSCNRWWWLYSPEHGRWAPVNEMNAFIMLMDGNGEPTRPLSITREGVYFPETLRERGWIPLG